MGFWLQYCVAAPIWGFAGFWGRVAKHYDFQRNQTQESVVFEGVMKAKMYNDGSIVFAWLFNIIWFAVGLFVRGLIFPFFYAKLMLLGDKELKKELQNAEENREKFL